MEVKHDILKVQIEPATFCQPLLCLKEGENIILLCTISTNPISTLEYANPHFSEVSVPRKDQALKIFPNASVGIRMTWSNSFKSQR